MKATARAFGVAAIFTLTAYGQISTATLTGTLTDPTRAMIPGAQLELHNQATGLVKTAEAAGGEFTFTFLPIGTYTLAVRAAGFQKVERKGLTLVAGQVLRLDLQLELGNVTETITVSGGASLLDHESTNQLHTLSNVEVRELPQAKLDWTSLANLGTGMRTVSASGAPSGTGTIMMNGITGEAMSISVDGTNASSDSEVPTFGFYQQPNIINSISTDAIAEISIVKGIMPASVGGTMSGNVNIISKSGSNQFHGDAFELNSVSAENARNQFLLTKPRSTFNQYGAALGGRILKDKLFFFGSYEGVRLNQFQPLTGNVPSPYLVSISPAVYAPIFAAFPKVSQPANNPTALSVPYVGVGSLSQRDSNTTDRLDYYLSPTNQLTLRYTRGSPFKNTPRLISSNPQQFDAQDNMYNANFVHTDKGGAWTSSTRFGYNKQYMLRVDAGYFLDLEGVALSPWSSGGCEYYVLNGATATYIEDFSLNRGRHTISLGGIIQRLNSGRIDYNTANLSYSTLADFQANIPSTVTVTFDIPSSDLHTYQYGAYIKDDYRVTPSLTLNLGVRYDYFSIPKERDGRLYNRGTDPNRPSLGDGFGPYLPSSSIYRADHNNFQPRVGFAWSVGANRKTVIRGGGGIFVNPTPTFAGPVVEMQSGPNVPFRGIFNRNQSLGGGLVYPIARAAFSTLIPNLQSKGILSSNIAAAYVMPQNFPNAYSIQWMLDVERELGFGTTMSAGYVANRALKLSMWIYPNLPDRTTGVALDPTYASFVVTAPIDNSTYNSLQLRLNKRFSHGLTFQSGYTLAALNAFCGANLVGRCSPQDNKNIRADLGPAPFDIRHNFNASFVYELPLRQWTGASGRGAQLLLGGWQMSSIFTASSGLPINVRSAGSYPADRPDRVGSVEPILSNYTSTLQYLNPAAFATIPLVTASGAQARPGTLGRNAFHAPGLWNVDSSLVKFFAITEGLRLKLHGDLFNAFNHTNLSGVASTITATNFGKLTSATSRSIQFGARLEF